ncbi:MAG: HAMP domain-containing histidine kinase [Bacillus sp. (in: Bacteria)]|nr:HAMP domain-containing histidine kinase [Bacillus sp. (in: firmicutes)]MCM1426206.1 HAMP domain-containing histidine kinase [Eubacterium sp.]
MVIIMRILANERTKVLFVQMTFCIAAAVFAPVTLMAAGLKGEAVYVPICVLLAGMAALAVCYRYCKRQDKLMEKAVSQIREFIAGDRNARIECDEEGELYRLFHEVNSLAAILNAQAQNEEKSRRFLQNTMSDISHQLKTPLAALDIYNGIIQEEAGAEGLAAIKEFSDLSEKELERIENMVQNLLQIAKFDAGTMVMEKKRENISEIMMDVREQFLFRAKKEGKEIILKGDETLFFVCDRSWMAEAVGNIVKNALDHTGSGNHVEITWEQSPSAVRITIRDDGSGIHPEDMNHIFKRFYRSRYSQDTQGIGLGLALSKSVIEAHHGTIEAQSRLGAGAAFVIWFYLREQRAK